MASGGGKRKKSGKPPRDSTQRLQTNDAVTDSLEAIKETYSGDIIEIDGSVKEGGGQILRISVALSCLLQKPIHITKIRAGRSSPGLKPQHLTGIQLVASICQGKLIGDSPGSTEIYFFPGRIKAGSYVADTKTAGSICLLMQIALPCLIFAKGRSQLILKGGTNVDMAPPIEYATDVFKPLVEVMGIRFNCTVSKRGFFPKGHGEVVLVTEQVASLLKPVTLLDRGNITEVSIGAYTAGVVPRRIMHDMSVAAKDLVTRKYPHLPVVVQTNYISEREAFGNGSGIFLVAKSSSGCLFGGSCNGSRNEEAASSGSKAANELLESLEGEGCVDQHMQDQFIIFMALARGRSKIKTGPLTLHTETAIHIIELMTELKFNVQRVDDKHCIIECEGIGLQL